MYTLYAPVYPVYIPYIPLYIHIFICEDVSHVDKLYTIYQSYIPSQTPIAGFGILHIIKLLPHYSHVRNPYSIREHYGNEGPIISPQKFHGFMFQCMYVNIYIYIIFPMGFPNGIQYCIVFCSQILQYLFSNIISIQIIKNVIFIHPDSISNYS